MKKVTRLEKAAATIETLKRGGKTIVLVGGCFDILHLGHLKFLEKAKAAGDILLLALEPDEKVRLLKGRDRPVNKASVRAKNLIKTNLVDYVILLPNLKTDEDYFNLVKTVSPNIIAITEGDPEIKNKQKQAGEVGGKVLVVTPRLPNFSTSQLVKTL